MNDEKRPSKMLYPQDKQMPWFCRPLLLFLHRLSGLSLPMTKMAAVEICVASTRKVFSRKIAAGTCQTMELAFAVSTVVVEVEQKRQVCSLQL